MTRGARTACEGPKTSASVRIGRIGVPCTRHVSCEASMPFAKSSPTCLGEPAPDWLGCTSVFEFGSNQDDLTIAQDVIKTCRSRSPMLRVIWAQRRWVIAQNFPACDVPSLTIGFGPNTQACSLATTGICLAKALRIAPCRSGLTFSTPTAGCAPTIDGNIALQFQDPLTSRAALSVHSTSTAKPVIIDSIQPHCPLRRTASFR